MIRLAIPLTLFAALGALLYAGLGRDPTVVPSPLIDRPAPAFELPTLGDDDPVASAELAGRPYVLNVWASWCPGCRVEHELVTELAQRSEAPLIGLNWKDKPDDARRWLAQFGDPYDAIAVDESGRVGIDFGVYGAPETFIVDAEGTVRYKHIGPITDAALNGEILPLISRLLAAAPG